MGSQRLGIDNHWLGARLNLPLRLRTARRGPRRRLGARRDLPLLLRTGVEPALGAGGASSTRISPSASLQDVEQKYNLRQICMTRGGRGWPSAFLRDATRPCGCAPDEPALATGIGVTPELSSLDPTLRLLSAFFLHAAIGLAFQPPLHVRSYRARLPCPTIRRSTDRRNEQSIGIRGRGSVVATSRNDASDDTWTSGHDRARAAGDADSGDDVATSPSDLRTFIGVHRPRSPSSSSLLPPAGRPHPGSPCGYARPPRTCPTAPSPHLLQSGCRGARRRSREPTCPAAWSPCAGDTADNQLLGYPAKVGRSQPEYPKGGSEKTDTGAGGGAMQGRARTPAILMP